MVEFERPPNDNQIIERLQELELDPFFSSSSALNQNQKEWQDSNFEIDFSNLAFFPKTETKFFATNDNSVEIRLRQVILPNCSEIATNFVRPWSLHDVLLPTKAFLSNLSNLKEYEETAGPHSKKFVPFIRFAKDQWFLLSELPDFPVNVMKKQPQNANDSKSNKKEQKTEEKMKEDSTKSEKFHQFFMINGKTCSISFQTQIKLTKLEKSHRISIYDNFFFNSKHYSELKTFLSNFFSNFQNPSELSFKSNILIWGQEGVGKTFTLNKVLKEFGIDANDNMTYCELSNCFDDEISKMIQKCYKIALQKQFQKNQQIREKIEKNQNIGENFDANLSISSDFIILVIDGLQAISKQSGMFKTQNISNLSQILEENCKKTKKLHSKLIIFGITNEFSSLPPNFTRSDHFEIDFCFEPPKEKERALFFSSLFFDFLNPFFAEKMSKNPETIESKSKNDSENIEKIIRNTLVPKTAGFVMRDLFSLIREALIDVIFDNSDEKTKDNSRSILDLASKLDETLTNSSFLSSWQKKNSENLVFNSTVSMIDQTTTDTPDTEKNAENIEKTPQNALLSTSSMFADVGGLKDVKDRLSKAVEWPLLFQESFKKLNLSPPSGILLYGPPGCGKTFLVKALAARTKRSVFTITSASVFSPYLGDSEKFLRKVFLEAKKAQPSIIFIDEMDGIVGKRNFGSGDNSDDSGSTSGVDKRVLSTVLNEMDGIEKLKGVLVIGATNRPDNIDVALLRPGRIDHIVYVPPPDIPARSEILQKKLGGILKNGGKLVPELSQIAAIISEKTKNFSGADVDGLIREACMHSIRSSEISKNYEKSEEFVLTLHDFEEALKVVHKSISDEQIEQYKNFEIEFLKRK